MCLAASVSPRVARGFGHSGRSTFDILGSTSSEFSRFGRRWCRVTARVHTHLPGGAMAARTCCWCAMTVVRSVASQSDRARTIECCAAQIFIA